MKNKKGFTLIELLVVIAIIGLLSTLAIVSLNTARQKSRDTKRQADIRTLQSAVELYINENGSIPALPDNWTAFGGALSEFLASSTPPEPPQTGCNGATLTGDCYTYCTDVGGTAYLLAAYLETPDPVGGDLNETIGYGIGRCRSSDDNTNTGVVVAGFCADPRFCLGS